jgi:hypothetical protein
MVPTGHCQHCTLAGICRLTQSQQTQQPTA